MMVEYGERFWKSRWERLYGSLAGNPLAAMPSLHFATSVTAAHMLSEQGRIPGALGWAYTGTLGFALVYLGEHYVVDIAVGMLITAYAWFAAGYWIARIVPVLRDRLARPATPRRAVHGVGA